MSLRLTPAERAVYEYLGDGEPHTTRDLLDDLDGMIENEHSLYVIIYNLKLKVPAVGEEIVSQRIRSGNAYRRFRHLHAPLSGT